MKSIEEQVGGLARVRDEDLAERGSGAGARTLLESIMAAESAHEPAVRRRARPVRRLAVAAVVVSALAAAAVIGPGLIEGGRGVPNSYANSAIEIEQRGDAWVARVKDPYANPGLYGEAFKAVGLDVSLNLVPASPSGVGKVVRMGFSGNTSPGKGLGGGFEPEGCDMGSPGCALAVTVAVGFTGTGVISLGRPAKPGEQYENAATATTKGELLHGVKVDERTVGEVREAAAERGVKTKIWVIEPTEPSGYSYNPKGQPEHVGDDWIVWDAEVLGADTVKLLVTEKRLAKNPIYDGPKQPDIE